MNQRIIKSLGPPLAMLTFVAYLSWGHLAPPHALEASRPKMPTINPQRLNPDLSDRYERDPFRTTAVVTKADEVKQEEAAVVKANLRAARREKQTQLSEQVNQLVLNGAVLGSRPQAIINQRIFRVGEVIPLTESEVGLRVSEIGRDWVRLDCDLIQVKLTYNEPVQITMIDDPSLLSPTRLLPWPSPAPPAESEEEKSNWWQQLKDAVRNVSAEG